MHDILAASPVRRLVRKLATLAALMLLCGAPAARAQVWSEAGDAGQTTATAQLTIGAGALTMINGSLSSASDVDLYCIHLRAVPPANLALVNLGCVVSGGPNVYLFDSAGNGVFMNSQCQFGSKTIYAPNWSLPAGNYYVAVAYTGIAPSSIGGLIWQNTNGYHAADGPGAASPLLSWGGVGNVQPSNPYQLTFQYMEFCDAATPAARPTWGALKLHYGN